MKPADSKKPLMMPHAREVPNIGACRRCGTCCQKGGPALHRQDAPLVLDGHIALKRLFTIREGEPARDNVRGGMTASRTDIIKIKGSRGGWTCTFFQAEGGRCRIYRHRPVECRLLKCWDTADIEAMYGHARLIRRDLLERSPGLWDLVQDHHEQCSYALVAELLQRLESADRDDALASLTRMIHYDRHLRQVVVERAKVDPQMCDLLFGRLICDTLPAFGFRWVQTRDRCRIEPLSTP